MMQSLLGSKSGESEQEEEEDRKKSHFGTGKMDAETVDQIKNLFGYSGGRKRRFALPLEAKARGDGKVVTVARHSKGGIEEGGKGGKMRGS